MMIDPKYADLPGIAYDQPDLYETVDVPESESLLEGTLQQDEGESVEKIIINSTVAFQKFKDKHVQSRNVDFSDTIGTKKRIGYNVCGGTWELSFRDDNDETPFEKYQRIKFDIEELVDQITLIKENTKECVDSKSLSDIIHQIDIISKQLDSMNIEKHLNGNSISFLSNYQDLRFKELQSQIQILKQKDTENYASTNEVNLSSTDETQKNGALKYQMIYFPDKAKVQDMARITSLEKRLGYLENIIGTSADSSTKCTQILRSQGISKSVEKIMSNAYLLNCTQLDILENKISSLLHKMDNILQKKSQAALDSKHEKTVIELFDLIKQFENCFQILPQTIDRMLSVNSLHLKAADFTVQLQGLEKIQSSINGSLINNRMLLETMQKNLSSNLEIIGNDVADLNKRVTKLK